LEAPGREENRSFAEDARQLIDQRAHARSALYVGVDNEPDVEPVGLLAGKGPLQLGSGIAHEARQIARAPAEAHGLEDSRDAVGPKSDAAAWDAVLDVAQWQPDAVGIAHCGELCRPLPPATDVGRHGHTSELACHQGRLGGPNGTDGDVGLSPGDIEAGDGADQLDRDARVTHMRRLQRGQDEVSAEDLRRGDAHASGELSIGAQGAALGSQRRELHLLRRGAYGLARGGERKPAGRALEELCAHLLFKARQAARNRSLVDAELARCCGQRAGAAESEEDPQAVPVRHS